MDLGTQSNPNASGSVRPAEAPTDDEVEGLLGRPIHRRLSRLRPDRHRMRRGREVEDRPGRDRRRCEHETGPQVDPNPEPSHNRDRDRDPTLEGDRASSPFVRSPRVRL